jgi:AcrR family transcriptional regulator
MESYWRDGVENISLNEICRRTGISKPGLYREFGGEDQLMEAVLAHYTEVVLAPTLATLAEERPFWDTIQALTDHVTRDVTPDVPLGCLFAKMRSSSGHIGPITQERIHSLRAQAVYAYGAWLEASVSRGDLALSCSPQLAATYIDAQVTGFLMQMAAGEDPEEVRAHAALAFSALGRHRVEALE